MAPSISPTDVLAATSAVRQDGSSATLCFGTDKKPLGYDNGRTYAVEFPDGDIWAVRIPWFAAGNLTPTSIADLVKVEMETLRELQKCGFRWSPRLLGGDSSFDNPIGHPYLVLSWIHGTPLEWTPTSPSQEQQRHKILRQLMDIQLELVNSTLRSRPGSSALGVLTDAIDGQILRVLCGELPEIHINSSFVHRALARHAVHEDLESSAVAISHNYLIASKIIIDQEFNITGIIDWKMARFRPVQLALRFPRLLSVDEDSIVESPTVGIAPTSRLGLIHTSPKLLDDRRFISSYIAALDTEAASENPLLPTSLANSMRIIMSDHDVDWQDLVIQSCFRKGLNSAMAERSWLLGATREGSRGLANTPLSKMADEGMRGFLEAKGTEEGFEWKQLARMCQGEENLGTTDAEA